MIRSTFRNVMVTVLVICMGVAFYVFRWAQDFQTEIASRQSDIIRLKQELENARSLDVALTELDNLTVTEQTATQLDILRHLGLEQSDLDFQMESREEQVIGNTTLFVHNVRISGPLNYESALALSDRLQNTKKIVLKTIEINAPTEAKKSEIAFAISGRIYGLNKTLPPEGAAVAVEASPDGAPAAAGVETQPGASPSETEVLP